MTRSRRAPLPLLLLLLLLPSACAASRAASGAAAASPAAEAAAAAPERAGRGDKRKATKSSGSSRARVRCGASTASQVHKSTTSSATSIAARWDAGNCLLGARARAWRRDARTGLPLPGAQAGLCSATAPGGALSCEARAAQWNAPHVVLEPVYSSGYLRVLPTLVVFLPGTGTAPAAYGRLLAAAQRAGHYVVGLSYLSQPVAVSQFNAWCGAGVEPRSGPECNARAHASMLFGVENVENVENAENGGSARSSLRNASGEEGQADNNGSGRSVSMNGGSARSSLRNASGEGQQADHRSAVHVAAKSSLRKASEEAGPADAGLWDVSAADYCVEALLESALASVPWGGLFLRESGEKNGGNVTWDRVIVSGHSQGAGHAAFWAQSRPVLGAALLSGPQDTVGDALPWLHTMLPASGDTWWRVLLSAHEECGPLPLDRRSFCEPNGLMRNLAARRLVTSVSVSNWTGAGGARFAGPGSSGVVVSFAEPSATCPYGRKYHCSVALDRCAPLETTDIETLWGDLFALVAGEKSDDVPYGSATMAARTVDAAVLRTVDVH
jgi:hypothetical protein